MKNNRFIFFILPSVIGAVLNVLILTPISTYYLDPVDFGVFAIITIILSCLGPISSLATRNILSGFYYNIDKNERGSLVFSALLAEPLLILVLGDDYENIYLTYFYITILSFIFASIWPSVSYLFVLAQEGKKYALAEISRFATRIFVTIILLSAFQLKLLSLFLGAFSADLISFIVAIFIIRQKTNFNFSMIWFKDSIAHGKTMSFANVIDASRSFLERKTLQDNVGLLELGLYNHSLMYQRFFNQFGSSLGRVIGPESLKVYSGDSNGLGLNDFMYFVAWLLTCIGLFLAFFSEDIVSGLTHNKFTSIHYLLVYWFLMYYPSIIWCKDQHYLYHCKDNYFLSLNRTLLGITSIPMMFILGYYWGVSGVVTSVIFYRISIRLSEKIRSIYLGNDYSNNELQFLLSFVFILIVHFVCMHYVIILEKRIFIYFILISIFTYIYRGRIINYILFFRRNEGH